MNSIDFIAFDLDGTLLDTATVIITVTPVNDAPVASADTVTTNEDTGYSGSFSATDVENDSLFYAIASNPANGTVTITSSSSGTYTYSPVSYTHLTLPTILLV